MAEIKYLTGESTLAFLLIHDPEEAQHLGLHIPLESKHLGRNVPFELVHDVAASLTVRTTNQKPLEQFITVTVPERGLVFEHKGKFDYPRDFPYPLQDCENKPGTLYVRGEYPPPGKSGFNAQQFPRYPANDGTVENNSLAGRVLIDFWNAERITAVPMLRTISLEALEHGTRSSKSQYNPLRAKRKFQSGSLAAHFSFFLRLMWEKRTDQPQSVSTTHYTNDSSGPCNSQDVYLTTIRERDRYDLVQNPRPVGSPTYRSSGGSMAHESKDNRSILMTWGRWFNIPVRPIASRNLTIQVGNVMMIGCCSAQGNKPNTHVTNIEKQRSEESLVTFRIAAAKLKRTANLSGVHRSTFNANLSSGRIDARVQLLTESARLATLTLVSYGCKTLPRDLR
ncbi:hypothetical protein BS17DRAFT_809139 [Gyrodon lividus]|nr:hypothetical protein BS17DRAFT_809139 [Gyrodon lividus]